MKSEYVTASKRTSRADLLRSLIQTGESSLNVTAEMIGFKQPKQEKIDSIQLPISELDFTSIPKEKDNASKITQNNTKPIIYYHRVIKRKESELLPPPIDGVVQLPDWFKQTPDLDLQRVKPANVPPLRKQPLVSWSVLWPVLQSLLSEIKNTRQVDIPKLIKTLANGEMLAKIPRQSRMQWAQSVQVLLDYPERTELFNQDYNELINGLEQLRGTTGLNIQRVLDEPGKRVRIRQANRYFTQAWKIPNSGTVILIITDLGLLDESGLMTQVWLAFGKKLQRAGFRAIVLLPLATRYLSPELVNVFDCITWERSSSLKVVCNAKPIKNNHPSPLEQDKNNKAKVLLAWLSPAVRVEPSLLRAVRHLLSNKKMDIGGEIAAWRHEDVTPSSIGFHYNPSELKAYRTLFVKQVKKQPEVAKKVAALIISHHLYSFPTQRYEELLILDDLMGKSLTNQQKQEVKNARLHMRQLFKALYNKDAKAPALLAYSKNYLARQHEEMWERKGNEFLSAMWGVVNSRYPVIGKQHLPSYLNQVNALTFLENQTEKIRDYTLFQEGEKTLYLATKKRYKQGLNDFTQGSALLSLKDASRYALGQTVNEPSEIESVLLPLNDKETYPFELAEKEQQRLHISGEEITVERFNKPSWAYRIGRDEKGLWADVQISGITQRFRWIEPTSFIMGSPKEEKGRLDNEMQHKVTLSEGYWLADTACTQALWQAVMGKNPSSFKEEDNPVENVNWDDTQEFIKKINQQYPELQLRLPTEAEWENACRAGTETAFSFEGELSLDKANYRGTWDDYMSYGEGALEQTAKVKSYPANTWGLYEMHGNVWEWCQDWYGDYPTEKVIDPKGVDAGTDRVLRGGSWINGGRRVRSAYRNRLTPGYRYNRTGFRLARGAFSSSVRAAQQPDEAQVSGAPETQLGDETRAADLAKNSNQSKSKGFSDKVKGLFKR